MCIRDRSTWASAEDELLLRELYRLALCVFYRISAPSIEEPQPAELDIWSIILSGWYLDTVKLLDLIAIYGSTNQNTINDMVNLYFVHAGPMANEDIEGLVKAMKDIIEECLKEVVSMRKREDLSMLASDDLKTIEARFKLIQAIEDLTRTIEAIASYFPARVLGIIDTKMIHQIDNLFCMLPLTRHWANKTDIGQRIKKMRKTTRKLLPKSVAFIIKSRLPKNKKLSKEATVAIAQIFSGLGDQRISYTKRKDEKNYLFLAAMIKHGGLGEALAECPMAEEILDEKLNAKIEEIMMTLVNYESIKQQKPPEAKPAEAKPQPAKNQAKEVKESVIPESKEQVKQTEVADKAPQEKAGEGRDFETDDIMRKILERREKGGKVTKGPQMKAYKGFNEYEDEYDDTLEMYRETKAGLENTNAEVEMEQDADMKAREEVVIEGEMEEDEELPQRPQQPPPPQRGGRGGDRGQRGRGERRGQRGGGGGGRRFEERRPPEEGEERYQQKRNERRFDKNQSYVPREEEGNPNRNYDKRQIFVPKEDREREDVQFDNRQYDRDRDTGRDREGGHGWRGGAPSEDFKSHKRAGAEAHRGKDKNKREYYRKQNR
eukprot:TRINITY_DN3086_c0_g1_i2.p1 TRINITY_DN3086_c0_g1~~TRINITY_DN3086_c0_g1_i2.p1  ORF type:complete len:626 (-),score=199.15 TRINITY_DN3086_c0_g1_i2:96-1907(-)